MSNSVKELDRVLSGDVHSVSKDTAELADVGRQIADAFLTVTPPHTAERAMFVRAVEDDGSLGWARFVTPAAVTAVLLLGLLFLGRTALPGGTFYPVRQVLRSVGLAPASVEEVQELLDWADRLLDEAEEVAAKDPEAAERHAFEAVRVIGMAEGAVDELEIDERAQFTDELARLVARAKAILTEAPAEDADRDVDGTNVTRGNRGEAKSARGRHGRSSSLHRSSNGERGKDVSRAARSANPTRKDVQNRDEGVRKDDEAREDALRSERAEEHRKSSDAQSDARDEVEEAHDVDDGDIDADEELDLLKRRTPGARRTNRPRD